MTIPAQIQTPRLMLVGGGAAGDVASVLDRIGVTRPLIVTDPFMVSSGLIARVTDPLTRAGVPVEVFADTVPDPTTDVIEDGVKRLAGGPFDGLIGFGGGSPMDTAKAIAILAAARKTDPGTKMRDWKVPAAADHRDALPLVLIPTTAGTGSEVTRFTVITDTETSEKMLIMGLAALGTAAIVDYELTLAKPFRLTADTGIDTLTHAIEARVSKKANPMSAMYARSAMELVWRHLVTACREPGNREAREGMMLAATQAGMAFSNASVALVHGMSRPIGAFFHVPHGLSNAMLLPAVTRFSLPEAGAAYADCARAMGVADGGDDDPAAGGKLLDALDHLNRTLEVPSPRAHGIEPERYHNVIGTMADQALASGSPANNPRVPTHAEIVGLYRDVWG